jgi:hypothetical protein
VPSRLRRRAVAQGDQFMATLLGGIHQLLRKLPDRIDAAFPNAG